MHVAIFTELYFPSIGGQEMFFAGLGRTLLQRGHEVDVYCIGHREGLAKRECIDGVNVNRFPIAPNYQKPLFSAMKRDWATIGRYAWHVRTVTQTHDHDFYLLNQWPLLHAVVLPRYAKRRALLHWCEVRHSAFYRMVQKILPHSVGLNAAISDTVSEQIRQSSGRQVITLPSGLDLSRGFVRNRSDRSGVVVLGRITAHKNISMLVEAFELLKADGYAGRLKIAGDGPDMPTLCARVDLSPVRDEIDLLGFISDDRKFDLLANSEVLAMPSKREGFPHVVSEAMCCGLPIVTADYPENGTKAIVEMFKSGVVSGQNTRAFADAIKTALSSWEFYSANGLAMSATLDWNGIAKRLETQIRLCLRRLER